MIDLELFDLETFLAKKGIQYWTHGKNVSTEWLGVTCPFCPDHSNHLGIHRIKKTISCWKCGETGTIVKYLAEVLGSSVADVLSEIEKYSSRVLVRDQIAVRTQNQAFLSIKNIVKYLDENSERHKNYLRSRNFDPEELEIKYGIFYSGPVGKYANRIIIPVTMYKREISFTSRAIDDRSRNHYLAGAIEEVVMPIKECIYNLDSINDVAIICEGAFDVWNIGDGCTCTFGVKYTKYQLWILQRTNIKRIFVLFDAEKEAEERAEQMGFDLAGFIPEVKILYLTEGDPAELSKADVKSLRKQVFGKIY